MIELARLRPGRGFSAVRFFGYYSLRLVPFISVRRLIARVLAWYVDRGRARSRQDPASVRVEAPYRTLVERGVWMAPMVADSRIAEMREFLRKETMYSRGPEGFTEANVPPGTRLASYPVSTILRCPHVVDLMNDSLAIELAERYIGCRPTISGVRIDWSFASGNGTEEVQRFHRDHDDWAFLKFFLYLTDVDEGSGPHQFVVGSHRTSERFSAAQYPDELVERDFGLTNAVKILGPRGTCFYEDTWGIHKGIVPNTRSRLIFQVQYSILPIFKYRYRPEKLDVAQAVDAYVNRLLISA